MQIPCYNEDESTLRKTIESCVQSSYEKKRKLLFIVADGMVAAAGQKPTYKILLEDIFDHSADLEAGIDNQAHSYTSFDGNGAAENRALCCTGHYRGVPYVVVIKVGREDEKDSPKPGNRGKRDSQLLAYNFFHYVNYRSLWSPLFENLEFKMRICLNMDARDAMYMLAIDCDTEVDRTGISYLVDKLQNRPKLLGVCGYTGVGNSMSSFVASSQVFEYWLTHAVLKAVEIIQLRSTRSLQEMEHDLYPHRGFMLDTGRKFFPVQAILELLTVLHQYNFNVFHWHIYDAESFPIHWPASQGLTNASMKHSHTSQCYTPEDIWIVISHAQRLEILVYPETDMPGHGDIWGLWKQDLVVGTPDLKEPQAQLDIRQSQTYGHIASLVSTVDTYFKSPLHHFGGDEVAYIWQTEDDNKLFETFLGWLKQLEPNKTLILWDDPLTDEGKSVSISKDWVIQTWHNGASQDVLNKGHRIIVSESDVFYIGNADCDKITSFKFPEDPNVLGFEVVWFTSEGDNPYDFRQSWVMEPIRAASKIRRTQNPV
ncbi:hypothetical protein N0V86_003024 [Didymella sp. IMI 355093]|nr:hypothetical protein N0V86_003024 [Didymella sp. IMI 355093]